MIVQNAGIMIDHQRGGASLMVNDPTIQNQSSPLGTLFNLVLIYLFFLMDGPFIVLDIISESYAILPPDKMMTASIFDANSKSSANHWNSGKCDDPQHPTGSARPDHDPHDRLLFRDCQPFGPSSANYLLRDAFEIPSWHWRLFSLAGNYLMKKSSVKAIKP